MSCMNNLLCVLNEPAWSTHVETKYSVKRTKQPDHDHVKSECNVCITNQPRQVMYKQYMICTELITLVMSCTNNLQRVQIQPAWLCHVQTMYHMYKTIQLVHIMQCLQFGPAWSTHKQCAMCTELTTLVMSCTNNVQCVQIQSTWLCPVQTMYNMYRTNQSGHILYKECSRSTDLTSLIMPCTNNVQCVQK